MSVVPSMLQLRGTTADPILSHSLQGTTRPTLFSTVFEALLVGSPLRRLLTLHPTPMLS